MTLIVLRTDLFPDAETLENALRTAFGSAARFVDLTRPDMEEADWQEVADLLLSAERIITV